MKSAHWQQVRLAIAVVTVAVLAAVMTYVLYGSSALFSLRGVTGVVVQTLIFAVGMWWLLSSRRPQQPPDVEASEEAG